MPQLPRYSSQGKLNTGLAAPVSNVAKQESEVFMEATKTVIDVGQKWQQANNLMQETFVKSKYSEAQAQIEVNAENDIDINGEDKQINELKKQSEQFLKGVTDPNLRNQLKLELDHSNELSSIKIRGIYGKKKIFADNLNTESLIDTSAKERSDAQIIGNKTLIQEKDASILALIQKKVASGFYTATQGEALLKSYKLGSVDYAIQADPATTQKDSQVLQDLMAGESGIYYDLDNKERADRIKETKINIHRNKLNADRVEQEITTESSLDMAKGILDKSLTLGKIDSLRRSGAIDIKTAGIFENAIVQQDVVMDKNNTTVDSMIRLLEKDDKSALSILTEATKLRGTTGFDDNAYAFILQEVAKKADREKKGLKGNDNSPLVNALKGIKDFAYTYGSNLGGTLVGKFIERVQGGQTPDIAKKEIIEEELNNQIENSKSGLPPEKIKMKSPDGRLFRIPIDKVLEAEAEGFKNAE